MPTRNPSPELRRYLGDLASAEATASAAISRVDALRKVVEGLQALEQTESTPAPRLFEEIVETVGGSPLIVQAPPATVSLGPAPRGREAVRGVLVESSKAWKIPDLADEIGRRGWMPDVASRRDATAATVQRLVKDGEVERVGHGVYRYRLDKLPPLEVAAGKEDGDD